MERRVFAIHGSGKRPTDRPIHHVSNFDRVVLASTIERACEAARDSLASEGWTDVEIYQAVSRTGKMAVLIVDEDSP